MPTLQTLLVTCLVHHLLVSENQIWTFRPVFCHCWLAQKTLCQTCLHLLPGNHYWRSQFLCPFSNPECCVPNHGRSVHWCTLCHKWSVEVCTHLHCSPPCHHLFSNNKGSAVSSQDDLMAFPLCHFLTMAFYTTPSTILQKSIMWHCQCICTRSSQQLLEADIFDLKTEQKLTGLLVKWLQYLHWK